MQDNVEGNSIMKQNIIMDSVILKYLMTQNLPITTTILEQI